jgi:predicted Ser/Thr protein kinase
MFVYSAHQEAYCTQAGLQDEDTVWLFCWATDWESVENVSLFVVLAGELLGSGSFGRVFAARWDGRDVAVKVIEHSSETGEQL